jgi:hypothetical protein
MKSQPAKTTQKDKKQSNQASRQPTAAKWDEMNRKQRREMMRKMQSEDLTLEVVHPHAAGIDIGNESHCVAVPPSLDPQPVRCFGCTTAELRKMAAWLIEARVVLGTRGWKLSADSILCRSSRRDCSDLATGSGSDGGMGRSRVLVDHTKA